MSLKDYLGVYSLLERDPVVVPQWIKDGLVLTAGGLVIFDVITITPDQIGWILAAVALVSAAIAKWSRNRTWPDERVQNEFLSAEDALVPTKKVKVEEVGPYGEVHVVTEDE